MIDRTKFEIIYEKEKSVRRTRLIEIFKKHRYRKFFWLSGPPGSGKTYFLSQLKKAFKENFHYYRIDERDKDLTFFMRHFYKLLDIPIEEEDYYNLLKKFVEVFALTLTEEHYIVFDNYQEIQEDKTAIKFISHLITETPSNFHFLFASLKSYNLGKFPEENLKIIGEQDLWFTKEEIKRYYWKTNRIKLDETVLDSIYETTKGWPIALNIIERDIKNRNYYDIKNFSREQIFEWMDKKILSTIPDEKRGILYIIAGLPEVFNISDIRELLPPSDVKGFCKILDFFNANNLFVCSQGKGVFRVHPLFQIFLREREKKENSSKWKSFAKESGKYFEDKYLNFAIELYLHSGNWEILKSAIDRKYAFVIEGNLPVIEQILKKLPASLKKKNEFLFLKGIYLHKKGRYNSAQNIFSLLCKSKNPKYKFLGNLFLVEDLKIQGRLSFAIKHLKRYFPPQKRRDKFLPTAGEERIQERMTILNQLGTIYFSKGNLKNAYNYFKEVYKNAQIEKNKRAILTGEINLALVNKEKGILNDEQFLKLLSICDEEKDITNKTTLLYHLSEILFLKDEIEKAKFYLREGKKITFFSDEFLYNSFLELEARIKIAERNFKSAEKILKEVINKMRRMGSSFYLSPHLHLGYLYLKKEDYASAFDIFDSIRKDAEEIEFNELKALIQGFYGFIIAGQKGDREGINIMKENVRRLERMHKFFGAGWLLLYLIKVLEIREDKDETEAYQKKFFNLLKKNYFPFLVKEKEEIIEERRDRIFVEILGMFRILKNNEEIPLLSLKGEKTRKVLKFFFCNLNQLCIIDVLLENFWKELNPKNAKNNLYFTISEIRKFLEKNNLPFELMKIGEGYTLSGSKESLDACNFLSYINRAHTSGNPEEITKNIDSAIKLYKGEFLSCERYSEWCFNEREWFLNKKLQSLLFKARTLIQMDRIKLAEETLKEVIDNDPTNVEGYRLLLKCYRIRGEKDKVIKLLRKCKKEFYLRLKTEPPDDLKL